MEKEIEYRGRRITTVHATYYRLGGTAKVHTRFLYRLSFPPDTGSTAGSRLIELKPGTRVRSPVLLMGVVVGFEEEEEDIGVQVQWFNGDTTLVGLDEFIEQRIEVAPQLQEGAP